LINTFNIKANVYKINLNYIISMAKNLRILNANKKNQSMRDLEYGV